jgi:hypothetical protein
MQIVIIDKYQLKPNHPHEIDLKQIHVHPEGCGCRIHDLIVDAFGAGPVHGQTDKILWGAPPAKKRVPISDKWTIPATASILSLVSPPAGSGRVSPFIIKRSGLTQLSDFLYMVYLFLL